MEANSTCAVHAHVGGSQIFLHVRTDHRSTCQQTIRCKQAPCRKSVLRLFSWPRLCPSMTAREKEARPERFSRKRTIRNARRQARGVSGLSLSLCCLYLSITGVSGLSLSVLSQSIYQRCVWSLCVCCLYLSTRDRPEEVWSFSLLSLSIYHRQTKEKVSDFCLPSVSIYLPKRMRDPLYPMSLSIVSATAKDSPQLFHEPRLDAWVRF